MLRDKRRFRVRVRASFFRRKFWSSESVNRWIHLSQCGYFRRSRAIRAIIATAIWNICKDEEMLKVVLKSSYYSFFGAVNPYYEYDMIKVVFCLAQFPQKEARLRLEELTTNDYYLISYNAKAAINYRRSLYKIYD